MVRSLLYALMISSTLILILAFLFSTTTTTTTTTSPEPSSTPPPLPPPPPLATTCVAIEDFCDGRFNFSSNECRGRSPYCLFSCIQRDRDQPLRSLPHSSSSSTAVASSSCFLVRIVNGGLSEVVRFNCSDLAYCSLSCLGPGGSDGRGGSEADLAVNGPDRDRGGQLGPAAEAGWEAEEEEVAADSFDVDLFADVLDSAKEAEIWTTNASAEYD